MDSILRKDNPLRLTKKSVQASKILPPLDIDGNNRWDDRLEAIQYTTRVFAELDKQLGTDLVLAKLEPAQREFIQNQVKYAISLKKQIPDSEVANRVFLTLIAEVLIMAILHRNIEKNVLLEIIGGVRDPADEIEEATLQPKTVGGAIKEKLSLFGGGKK